METKRRSIVKAVSWRVFATLITGVLVWIFTHRIEFAIGIGLFDAVIKIFVYFAHERLWLKISYGKAKPPEYQI